jgi:hypothetical protein
VIALLLVTQGLSRWLLRPAVREQITQMVSDDILEVSPFFNPLTMVNREGKKPRICVGARNINQFPIPDYERTPPLQELLQSFEGAFLFPR